MVEIVKADLSRPSRIGVASFSTVRRLIDDRSEPVRRTSNGRKINGSVCAFTNVVSNCNFILRQYEYRILQEKEVFLYWNEHYKDK